LAVAIVEATWFPRRLAACAPRLWRLRVASIVRRLLRRYGLATRRQRLLVLEQRSATQAGLLRECIRLNAAMGEHRRKADGRRSFSREFKRTTVQGILTGQKTPAS
jgi:hypothetical protein